MKFLGHQVGGDVITWSRDKVRKTPRPTNKKQVRSFLGLIGYFRDHIPAYAEVSAPVTDLLKKGKAEHIQWSEAHDRAYSLLQEPVLKLPDLSKPFVLRTDAWMAEVLRSRRSTSLGDTKGCGLPERLQ